MLFRSNPAIDSAIAGKSGNRPARLAVVMPSARKRPLLICGSIATRLTVVSSTSPPTTAGLREHWELEQIALRPWPTSAANQAFVSALFELIQKHDFKAGDVKRMRIHLSPASHKAYVDRRTIRGKWEASGSVYYTAAVVLFDRELWMDQFEPARHNDPAVRQFALEQVQLISDATLSGAQTIVDVEMKSGVILSARCDEPKGTPENRMTRADIETKFRKGANTTNSAKGGLDTARVDNILDAITRLEEMPSVRTLMDALRTKASPTQGLGATD